MFEICIDDVKKWKQCIDAIMNLVKEGGFEIDENGIRLRAMDPSQIAMVIFTMKKESFSKFEIKEKTRLGINIETFSKFLSRVSPKEKMILRQDKGMLNIDLDGGKARRSFRLPLIDVVSGPAKELKIDYTAKIKIKGGVFKETMKDAALVSPHVLLVVDDGRFRVEASGEGGEVIDEYTKGDELLDINIKRTTSAVFSQEYLDDIIAGCDDDGELLISLGAPTAEDPRPKPLCVEYNIGNANLIFYLAPRIETE
ncbi:MAG: DNA polymerase sliding clamp [Candidatus Micrarchaeia archaeon]